MNTIYKIRDILRSIIEYEHKLEKEYGIGLNEAMLLCYLSKHDRATSGEIARRLKLTNSNTSKIIRSAENKELVLRIVGIEDKRQMFFSLTDLGMKRVTSISNAEIELSPLLKKVVECAY